MAFEVRPRLVRGLDYYTRTTFEITHGALGAQNSVLGGGRYDGLAEALGSKVRAPGIGFSIGEDRLLMTLEETAAGAGVPGLDLYIAPLSSLDALAQRSNVEVEAGHAGAGRRLLQRHDQAILADRKPDPGRPHLRAQRFRQSIVAPAAQHGILRAERAVRDLERRARIVIQPAHLARPHRELRCRDR